MPPTTPEPSPDLGGEQDEAARKADVSNGLSIACVVHVSAGAAGIFFLQKPGQCLGLSAHCTSTS